MKLGLSLEGGGAKGSYQVGAYLALIENGYKFDYIVGTSIGAINGVMMVQGREKELARIWPQITFKDIIPIEEETYEKISQDENTLETVAYKIRYFLDVVKNGGLPTDKIKELLDHYIDEDVVRNSDIIFGLATINLTDLKYEELFIADIPYGQLARYIMGSSNLPAFKQDVDEGEKHLLDGGVYKNNPYEMLEDKCQRIISILIFDDRYDHELENNPNIGIIKAQEELGDVLDFSSERAFYNMELGYYDGLRYVKGYLGSDYYIKKFSQAKAFDIISRLYKSLIDDKIGSKIINLADNFINFKEDIDYVDILVERIENMASDCSIERFEVYELRELAQNIYDNWHKKDESLFDFIDHTLIKEIIKTT